MANKFLISLFNCIVYILCDYESWCAYNFSAFIFSTFIFHSFHFTHFISLIRGHSETIGKREIISKHLEEIIRNKKYIRTNELRDIQDEIYYTRQETAKVPNYFFRWYQKQLNVEAEEYIEEVNKIYKSNWIT